MVGTRALFLSFAAMTLMACGKVAELPSLDETGDETGTHAPNDSVDDTQRMILNQTTVIRYEKSNVLEMKTELPPGTQVEFPTEYQVSNLNYRKSDGTTEWSSTGFLFPLKIVSVPTEHQSRFPASKIAELNATSGGLFVTATIAQITDGVKGNFAALSPGAPGEGFLKHYNASGKPKFNYTNSVTKRFGARLNKGVDPNSLPVDQRVKWQKIHQELRRAADRTQETSKSILMIDKTVATQASIDYEKTGLVMPNGAWTVAVQATSVRHGFSNVPCAEFMSEVLRQAYQRAGYRATEDFNKTLGNQLIWSNTAAVVNFSKALYTAGWVPWDATKYRPVVGAFLMNGSGQSPGHTYISSGDDGRFIVDNGAPQGRDLRKSTASTIGMMYQTGVFFLPPGINPPTW